MTITLERAITLYLNEQQKPATRKTYKSTLTPMMQFVGPARTLDRVSPDLLVEYMQTVRQRLKPMSINTHIKSIRTFFNWCIRIGWIAKSPALALKYAKKTANIDRDKAMPDADYDQLLDYAKWDDRAYAIVLFLGDTGCRRGGLAGLMWSHVDFSSNTAVVTEKGSKTRPVWFGDECAVALRRWHISQSKNADEPATHVFTHSGQPCTVDHVSKWFRRLCVKARIEVRGPHSLRHRKGFQLGDKNINPNIGAVALGHESPSITMQFYYPADYGRARQAMEDLAYKRDQKTDEKIVKFERIKRS